MDRNLFEYSKGRFYDEVTALKIFYEVCKAVGYLHSKNLLHRDIKPENILLSKSGEIKISDFGFSASFGFSESRNTMCGTKEYLPPEIIENKSQTDKVDIWCLGVLLYELLHKRLPFEGKNFELFIENIRRKQMTIKDDISPEVKEMIRLCLQENPDDRPSVNLLLTNSVFAKINDGVKPIEISKPSASGSVPPRSDQQRPIQFLNAIYQQGTENQRVNIPKVVNAKHTDSHKKGQNESVDRRTFLNDHTGPIYRRPVTQEIIKSTATEIHTFNPEIFKRANHLQNSFNFAPFLAESRLESDKQNLNPFNIDIGDNLKRSNLKSGNQTPRRNTDLNMQQNVQPLSNENTNSPNTINGMMLYKYNENPPQGQPTAKHPDVQPKLQMTHSNGKHDTGAPKAPFETEQSMPEDHGSPLQKTPKRIDGHANHLHFSYDFTDKTRLNMASTNFSTSKYYQFQTSREPNRPAEYSGKTPQLYKQRMRTPEVSQSRGFDNSPVHLNGLNSALHNNLPTSPAIRSLINSPHVSTLHESLIMNTSARPTSPLPTGTHLKFAKPVNAQQIEQYASQAFAKAKPHGEVRSNVDFQNGHSLTPNVYHPLNR